MICKTIFEKIGSKHDINCTPDLKKKSNNKTCLAIW